MQGHELSVVLAHGAWADGSSWTQVITPLLAAGHKVLAAPLPLTSLDADVASLDRTLEQALLAAVQRPIDRACISTPLPRPRWRELPSWFLVAEQDYMILPETQRFMAQRMGARVRTHNVDHAPLVTAPTVVVDLIRAAIAEIEESSL